MAAVHVKWLIVGACVAMTLSFPANPYEEGEYEKLLEMMEIMTAAKGSVNGGIPDKYRQGDFGDGDINRFAEYYSNVDYPPSARRLSQDNEVIVDVAGEHGDMELEEDWQQEEKLSDELIFGQVGGLATCSRGDVTIFHRGERTWEFDTFFENNTYADQDKGPIAEHTLLKADRKTGEFKLKWGQNKFYLPHGITRDVKDFYWVTDVALHQVFKMKEGVDEPVLTLGTAFEPAQSNDDPTRFCKPTDVAISTQGDIYISDGYCNSRVMRFNSSGGFVAQFDDDFYTPHSLALAEELDMICVADRDNRRIGCYNAGLKDPEKFGEWIRDYGSQDKDPKTYLGRVFAIEYSPKAANGGEGQFLYGVRGPEPFDTEQTTMSTGFTIDLADDHRYPYDIISWWSPWSKGFHEPHDLALAPDGQTAYVGELDDNTVWKFNKMPA